MNKAVAEQSKHQVLQAEMESDSLDLHPQHQSHSISNNGATVHQSLTQTDEAIVNPDDQITQLPLNETRSPQTSSKLAIVNSSNDKIGYSSKEVSEHEFGPIRVYLDQVKLYCQYQEWEKAIAVCHEILSIFPNTAEAYKLWGNILQQSGDEIAAMGCYAKALMSDPHYPEVYANLGSIYAKREQWMEAVSYYQKALELNPRFAGAYRNLSRVWKQLGKSEKSTQYLVYALTLDSSLGTTDEFYRLGNYLAQKDKRDEAIRFYLITLEQQPDHLLACQKLAELLELQGDWKSAVKYYRQVLEIRQKESRAPQKKRLPTNSPGVKLTKRLPQGANSRDQTQGGLSSETQKIQALRQAASADPNSFQHRLELGDAYAGHQDWEKAIEAYRSALRINPQLAKAYVKLGTSFSKLGKETEMAEAFHRAFEIDITLANAQQHAKLGQMFLKQGNVEKAVAALNRAIRRDPKFSDGYRQLGDALNLQGDRDAAMHAYRSALQVQSGEPVEKKRLASPHLQS